MSEVHVGPVVKVARDLTEILRMVEMLEGQAVHKANDRLMPGGSAMVALGVVASPATWERRVELTEHQWAEADAIARFAGWAIRPSKVSPVPHVADEDDAWEPPLQTLLFWSEQWRVEHGAMYDQTPTIASETNFIRWALDWAWDNEVHWNDFARDMTAARTRLENLLSQGERAERGVPCMYDECRGARLVRKLVPYRDKDGNKAWRHSEWHCPRCKRKWDDDAYRRHVASAHESTKLEEIDGETWCTLDYAARQVGRPESTLRAWLHRGQLSVACIIIGRRARFVNLGEVRQRHEEAQRRKRAS